MLQVHTHFITLHLVNCNLFFCCFLIPKCYRLHHAVRGWAWAGEGVCSYELPRGSGAGVDHSGPGKVTCCEEKGQKAPLCSSAAFLNGPSVCPEYRSLLALLSALLTLARTVRRNRLLFTEQNLSWLMLKTQCSVYLEKGCVHSVWYCTLNLYLYTVIYSCRTLMQWRAQIL